MLAEGILEMVGPGREASTEAQASAMVLSEAVLKWLHDKPQARRR